VLGRHLQAVGVFPTSHCGPTREKAIVGWQRRLDPAQSVSVDQTTAIMDKASGLLSMPWTRQ
jgi:hypothetical protein